MFYLCTSYTPIPMAAFACCRVFASKPIPQRNDDRYLYYDLMCIYHDDIYRFCISNLCYIPHLHSFYIRNDRNYDLPMYPRNSMNCSYNRNLSVFSDDRCNIYHLLENRLYNPYISLLLHDLFCICNWQTVRHEWAHLSFRCNGRDCYFHHLRNNTCYHYN